MASERKTGMVVPSGLLRPTTRHDDSTEATGSATLEGADDAGQGADAGDGEGRAPKVRRSRKIVKTADKIEGRKIYLSDDLYDRLRLFAIQRRANVSTVVAGILDREVPRFELTRVEK